MAKDDWIRRQILQDWRLLSEDRSSNDRFMGMDKAMGKVLNDLGLEQRFAEEEVMKEWGAIVGPFIAERSKPNAMRRKVLEVQVLESSVHYMLEREMRGELLARLQKRFGKNFIKDIRFTLG